MAGACAHPTAVPAVCRPPSPIFAGHGPRVKTLGQGSRDSVPILTPCFLGFYLCVGSSAFRPTMDSILEESLVIYGVAFLAACMIAGLFLGELLGVLIGVQANVGGVGIAMLAMILLSDRLRRSGHLSPLTEQGVLFWSAIYIPIVVAMAAKQNVLAAVGGGPAAILAGAGAVVACLGLVPVLSRLGAPVSGHGDQEK